MKKYRLSVIIEGENESEIIPCCDMEGRSLDEVVDHVRQDLENPIQSEYILILPCKIGTTVYCVVPDMSVTWPDPSEYKIITVAFNAGMLDDFGKTIFLTREEAEIARIEANKTSL